MIKDDGSVIHFNNPKVQASLAANTFAVTGHGENKQVCQIYCYYNLACLNTVLSFMLDSSRFV